MGHVQKSNSGNAVPVQRDQPHDQCCIIFDMDGVLVDSYEAHLQSWQALGRQTGVEFTQEQFAAAFGRTSREIISEHWRHANLTQDEIMQGDQRKEALYRELVEAKFPGMDGATELIAQLRQAGFLLVVGSSGPRENIDLALEKMGLKSAFRAIVSGSDVTRGKPDPQVFLLAAKRLAIPPSQCIVIEDAPLGVAAAHAAGMQAIALLSRGRTKSDFRTYAPEMFVNSLRELHPQLLRQLFRDQRA